MRDQATAAPPMARKLAAWLKFHEHCLLLYMRVVMHEQPAGDGGVSTKGPPSPVQSQRREHWGRLLITLLYYTTLLSACKF